LLEDRFLNNVIYLYNRKISNYTDFLKNKYMTSHEIIIGLIYWIAFFVLYLLRKKPPFNIIWKYTMIFFMVLIGTLLYNKWKDSNKRN
jgi:hypothetical protein